MLIDKKRAPCRVERRVRRQWTSTRTMVFAAMGALLHAGCGGCSKKSGDHVDVQLSLTTDAAVVEEPSAATIVAAPSAVVGQVERLRAQIVAESQAERGSLSARYPAPLGGAPPTRALSSANMAAIEKSSLALDAAEKTVFARHGFVITGRHRVASFVDAYATVYRQDLPVFVSVDSVLHAVHRGYEELLMGLDRGMLATELRELLREMRTALTAAPGLALSETTRRDLDVYLTVAWRLLMADDPERQAATLLPMASASEELCDELTRNANEAVGLQPVELFGTLRLVDFSSFKPRGHYTAAPDLAAYFRAMMWLGRIDLRIIETNPDGTRAFHRRQANAAVGLRSLMGATTKDRWERVDRLLSGLVGPADAMVPPQFDEVLARLHVDGIQGLERVDDEALAEAITAGHFGEQRIASGIMMNGIDRTLPLNVSFLLFPQRYVIDGHVLSNVTHDRVGGGTVKRMMPSPLDVAFAALGNNQSLELLKSELARYPYADSLATTRALVENQPTSTWTSSIYGLWLSSLRALSPVPRDRESSSGIPSVARTAAWGRRLLQTQLASWAELRHDAILYAKQSESGFIGCDFPDAWVDPYPEVFDRLVELAEKGSTLVTLWPRESGGESLRTRASTWFSNLGKAAATLAAIARTERAGQPLTAEQLAFINRAVTVKKRQVVCADPRVLDGWYTDLLMPGADPFGYQPTIADVHTQPTDEQGHEVGRILHVGTGKVRMMVVSVDGCGPGARAYVGPVSSYHERITSGWKRLDDEHWAGQVDGAEDVVWLRDLIAH